MAAEEVFLTALRRKIQACSNLLQSGSHAQQVLNRLDDLDHQIQEAASGSVISLEIANALRQAMQPMVDNAKRMLSQSDAVSTSFRVARNRSGYEITENQIRCLQSVGLSCSDMAQCLGVSLSTVKRRLRSLNLHQKNKYCQLTDDELDAHISAITTHNKEMGCKAIHARLKAHGLEVQRDRVQEAIKRVDPGGAAARAMALAPIERRVYRVDGPNALWHIDGNHKLVKWKIFVHAGVDGHSRMVVFIKASNNNRGATVKRLFVEGTNTYGIPSRLRMDKGVENQQTARVMTEHRGPGRGSAIQGKSVHNQRVERMWVDVAKDVLHPFHDLFTTLSVPAHDGGMGMLDINDRNHIWALHFVFLPRINNMLWLFKNQRNNQGLRTERNKTPNQLFTMGMLERHTATSTAAVSFWDEEVLTVHEEEDDDVYCPLSDERMEELKALVDPLSQPFSNEHAITLLTTVLQFLH